MRAPDFSDERLLAGLRSAAADLGEPLTYAGYDTWQRDQDAASPALIARRLGSWKAACDLAGVASNTTRSTSRRWTDEEVVAIVARYLASPGATGSHADYTAWAKEQEGVPSGATLRQRFSWAEAKRRAEEAAGA